MTLGTSFKPVPKPPVDKETEALKKVGVTDAEEVKEYKEMFLELREAREESNEKEEQEEDSDFDDEWI